MQTQPHAQTIHELLHCDIKATVPEDRAIDLIGTYLGAAHIDNTLKACNTHIMGACSLRHTHVYSPWWNSHARTDYTRAGALRPQSHGAARQGH